MNRLTAKIPTLLLILILMFVISRQEGRIFGTDMGDTASFLVINKKSASDPQDTRRGREKRKPTAQKSIRTSTTVPLDSVKAFYGSGITISATDSATYRITEADGGKLVGYAIYNPSVCRMNAGYAGIVPTAILTDTARVIRRIVIFGSSETPRFMSRVYRSGFTGQWNGISLPDAASSVSADAVSGATMTTAAVIRNVRASAAAAANTSHTDKLELWQIAKNTSVTIVVILSLICYFVPKRTRRWRLPVLAASVVVLGIMCGSFISIELLYKWLINGTSWAVQGVMIGIVAVSVLLPIIFGRQYYCMYLCPFGAAQELAGRLSKFKIHIPVGVLKIITRMHKYWLLIVVVLIILPLQFEPSSVEPFTVFMIRSASVSVIIIAAVSLIMSLFIMRPWCRFLCPTGALLNLIQRSGTHKCRKQSGKSE